MLDEPSSTVHRVPVQSLLPADSPRLEGVSHDHVQVLAGSGREFEPILVHRDAGRVVDGMHRLQAAILRGERDIAVRYVQGSPADLFIRSVQANTGHGLPLTLRDRKAAVTRILASHRQWSDRAIASVAGVSPKTVGAARARCSTEESPHSKQPTPRLGRDGRLRPADMPQRREKVLTLLTERPNATLREVAEEAGTSISTVHRMRQELRSCPDVPFAALARGTRLASVADAPEQSRREAARTPVRAMRTLCNDPSVRFTDSGRALLRWLNGQAQALAAGERLLEAVPPHCMHAVAEVAGQYAKEWERLADALRQTGRPDAPGRAAR
jgi:hypothetical protein